MEQTSTERPEIFFTTSISFLREIRQQFADLSFDRKMFLQSLSQWAISAAKQNQLSPSCDSHWIGEVARGCLDEKDFCAIVELADVLLEKRNPFRLSAHLMEKEKLARIAFEAAKELGNIEQACYFGLVLGESLYAMGRLDEAKNTFQECTDLDPKPERKLQLLRAIGQVSYRKGQYRDAQISYSDACRYISFARDEYVATLLHNQAKCQFRLGQYDEAAKNFKREIEIRKKNTVEEYAILRSLHELARIDHIQGMADDAERKYLTLLAIALAGGIDKFISAPLYQLVLLYLERGNLAEAVKYQEKLSEAAQSTGEALWTTLSELAKGMVEFERRNIDAAIELVTSAVHIARASNLIQIEEDAKDWIRRQIARDAERHTQERNWPALIDLVTSLYRGLDRRKAEKAIRYSYEPEKIQEINIRFMSNNGEKMIRWSASIWSCDCKYYLENQVCSHIAAMSLYDLSKLTTLLGEH